MEFTFWQKSIAITLAVVVHLAVLVSINFLPSGIKQVGLEGQQIELVAMPTFTPQSINADEVKLEEVETIEIVEEVKAIEIKEIEPKALPKDIPKIQIKKKTQEKKVAKKEPDELLKNDSKTKTDNYHDKKIATLRGPISTVAASNEIEASYKSTISAILKKYKKYPSRALKRKQEGTVTIEFTIQKDGELLGYKIKNSSGYRLLDGAVEKMLKRAIPLPPFPNNMRQNSITLILPVDFYIRS